MVIRSLVSSAVFSLPLADKLFPDVVARKLKGDQDSNDDLVPYPYPKSQESREQKIYKKILAKRKYLQVVMAPTLPLSGSTSTFSPAPPYSPNNQQFVEEDDDDYYPGEAVFSIEPIHKTNSPNFHRRDPSTNNFDSDYGTLIPSSASSQNVDYKGKVSFTQEVHNDQSPLGIYSSSSREETSNDRVNRYLEEQNEKFDALINRNIEVVLENDEPVLPLTLQESIYDLLDVRDRNLSHKFQDISSIVGIAASSVLPTISLPWRRKEATSERSLELLSSASLPSSSLPTSSSSPSLSLGSPSAFSYPSKSVDKAEYLPSVRAMVDDLDVYKKVQLYKYLQEDLDIFEDAKDEIPFGPTIPSSSSTEDLHYLQLSDSGITLDKIQALAILLVRLTFAGIKLAIPVSIRLYHKFTENDLYMINKKNFNSLLGFLIKLLKVVEEKVNGDTISVYQYGHQNSNSLESTSDPSNISPKGDPFNELYDEVANNASQFFSSQLNDATEEVIQKNDSSTWQGMAINYILSQYISSKDPNAVAVRRRSGKIHYKDPKYSKYYSKGGYQYRDDNFSSSSPSNSSNDLISESERNNMSILRAAEEFAGEL